MKIAPNAHTLRILNERVENELFPASQNLWFGVEKCTQIRPNRTVKQAGTAFY